ncbi:MAG: photosystem II protein PsbQ [Prochloraceae cyanobacterium]|nr:photosystem II protein PsbQ [Prochloraceae cyanobacterium]
MPIIRSVFSLILVLVTVLLVSCGSPQATEPTTYSAEQIEEIQSFLEPVLVSRERMKELESLINDENWIDTDNLIHGPLGSLRRNLRYLSDNLLPEDQKRAKQLSKELFADIERIDVAAKNQNYSAAVQQYTQTIRDFDTLLDLIPTSEDT